MVHKPGMQNVLLENKKVENISECGLRSAGFARRLDRFAELRAI